MDTKGIIMTDKEQIKAYYEDQLNFYTNRKKKVEKAIEDKKRVGLPVTILDTIKLGIESGHVLEFKNELKTLDN